MRDLRDIFFVYGIQLEWTGFYIITASVMKELKSLRYTVNPFLFEHPRKPKVFCFQEKLNWNTRAKWVKKRKFIQQNSISISKQNLHGTVTYIHIYCSHKQPFADVLSQYSQENTNTCVGVSF